MRQMPGLGRVASPRRPHWPKHGRFGETALPALASLVSLMQARFSVRCSTFDVQLTATPPDV